MITGTVDSEGVPTIVLTIGGHAWTVVIDTGFNGDLEAPERLRDELSACYIGTMVSDLAAGQTIEEELFAVTLPFDDGFVEVDATFANCDNILIGTRLLQDYILTIDFFSGTILIERSPEA